MGGGTETIVPGMGLDYGAVLTNELDIMGWGGIPETVE